MRRFLLTLVCCVSVPLTAYGDDELKAKAGRAPAAFGYGGQIKMLYDRRQRPQAVYLHDKVHVVFNGGGEAGASAKAKTRPMAVTYDPRTRTFSDVVTLGRGSSDHHKGPVIWADEDDRLHVLYGCHRTPGTHLVSEQPDTIGRDRDAWKEAPEIAPGISYPTFHRVLGDRQLVYYRTGGHTSSWTYRISADSGQTWVGPSRDVTDMDLKGRIDWSSYQTTLPSRDGRFLDVAFMSYDDVKTNGADPQRFHNPRYDQPVPNEWKYNLYYVKIDLETHAVTNFEGEPMEAPIDIDQADARCGIWDTQWRGAGVPPTIALDENGAPAFLHVLSEDTLTEHRYYYVRREGGKWKQTPITRSNHQWNSCHLTRDDNGTLHAYLIVGDGYLDSGGYMDKHGGGAIEEWTSSDKGNTWRKCRDLTPDQSEYPGWRFNNIQPVTRPDGSIVDGMLLFYGWKDKDAPEARAFLLHEDTRIKRPHEVGDNHAPEPEKDDELIATLLAGLSGEAADSSAGRNTQASKTGLFDMDAIRDSSTLAIEVLQDWHDVKGPVPTRQKLVTISVGEMWPGQDYRMPVRMVVPANVKAKGFHLTGGNQPQRLRQDTRLNPVEQELIRGGVGLVYTVVQVLAQSGLGELGAASEARFLKTLNPHDKIQYWAWPATMMRAVTTAYAETEHFAVGKVAMSGGSKNGATPSMAILHDDRMTAVHASVSPIWDSPLRLCDRKAWEELEALNGPLQHAFLGGHFGPIYNRGALAAGHSWEELQELATALADDVFITRNLETLRARDVDFLFHPGTHDFVAYDLAWGGEHHPTIPLYLRANSGHGKNVPHPAAERGEQNKAAFLLEHFFDEVDSLLEAPAVESEIDGDTLAVTVRFKAGSGEESGRIWWVFNRSPDGSPGYLSEMIPEENWAEMEYDRARGVWTASIRLGPNAERIDFFSNHRKTIRYRGRDYPTYISCPYSRVELGH